MLNLHNILLATDFSSGAAARFAFAHDLARRTGATLHVLYAFVLHEETYERPAARPETEAEALTTLKKLGEDAIGDASASVQYAVDRNVAAGPAIVDHARAHDIDLIIVGTHGRRGVRRLILGSVAEEVLRMAPCPVLTIRPNKDDPNAPIEPPKSILVPLDFSRHSAAALCYAKELGSLYDAKLNLLHVVEETLHPAFYGIAMQSIYDIEPDIEEKAVAQMRRMFEAAPGPVVEATFEARPGRSGREIVRFAEEHGSGMIVMATHGLTGLEHFLVGSTTERVIRRAQTPVFTVKSFDKSLVGEAHQTQSQSGSDVGGDS